MCSVLQRDELTQLVIEGRAQYRAMGNSPTQGSGGHSADSDPKPFG